MEILTRKNLLIGTGTSLVSFMFPGCSSEEKSDIIIPKKKSNGDFGKLVLSSMYVKDNGEREDDFIHGPYGTLYSIVYDCNRSCNCPGDQANYSNYIKESRCRIEGPNNVFDKWGWLTGDTRKKGKWNDNDKKVFKDLELHPWNSLIGKIQLVIYESDPVIWPFSLIKSIPIINELFKREHDQLFCQTIRRQDTLISPVEYKSKKLSLEVMTKEESGSTNYIY